MAKYKIIYSKSYKKDIKKLNKQMLSEVEVVLDILASGEKLDEKYCDHALQGALKDFRDCHIRPDLILIYRIYKDELILNAVRIGSHSDLGF